MFNLTLNNIYLKLEKVLNLIQGYSEIDNLSGIFQMCRIKPYDWIFINHKPRKIIFYKEWFDEFNTLLVFNKKKPKIIFNSLKLEKDKVVCTDLYHGLSFDKIAKISKSIFIFAGKDEDLNENYFLFSFIGIDNYLRTYCYQYGEWKAISSLYLGLENLKFIYKNRDIQYHLNAPIDPSWVIPAIGQAWQSYLPVNGEVLSILEKEHNVIFPFLNQQYKGNT